MTSIWRFTLGRTETVSLPERAEFLHAEYIEDRWRTWWRVDTQAEVGDRHFTTFGTGWETKGTYLATAMDGSYVWHLFEVTGTS